VFAIALILVSSAAIAADVAGLVNRLGSDDSSVFQGTAKALDKTRS